MRRAIVGVILFFYLLALVGCHERYEVIAEKPVLYLYAQHETEVTVQLEFDGELTTTYPAYHEGWHVTAYPNGRLLNHADGREYHYLFWEGTPYSAKYDFSRGYCIAGKDTAAFLQDILPEIGLSTKEYNDFIVYWLPRMQGSDYNLISFQSEAYTDTAALQINPSPDNLLRVFMAWKPIQNKIDLLPQEFPDFVREGFTVVEWGGAQVS